MFWAAIAIGLFLIFGAGLLLRILIFALKLVCAVFGVLAALIYMILRQLVPFVAKHLAVAVPWLISALVAFGLTIYAFGRHFVHGENAIVFLEKLIPPKEFPSRRTEFSLLLIELTDSIHADIVEKLQAQVDLLRDFFKPVSDGE